MRSLADAACELPWLSPCAASLVALTREPRSGDWDALRGDPGLILLLMRSARLPGTPFADAPHSVLLRDAGVVDLALHCLNGPQPTFADWRNLRLFPIYRSAVAYARAAEAIASQCEKGNPETAWIAGLLAPLGWLATAALSESQSLENAHWPPNAKSNGKLTSERVPNSTVHHSPSTVHAFTLDSQAIGRRLATAWRLPAWLSAIVGHLGLPLDAAVALGADHDLFRIAQLAVLLVGEAGLGLPLPVGARCSDLIDSLQLPPDSIQTITHDLNTTITGLVPPADWHAPASVPMLHDLLRLSADNQKLAEWSPRRRLQAEVDALHDAVQSQRVSEESRLREMKLRALAELAAGAGHEINNPLAVISGQAQYLLASEEEPSRRKALQTIVGQTQRIHQTLTQLMQFAKPPVPRKQRVDLGGLLGESAAGLQSLADERQVRLVIGETPAALTLNADPGQIRAAVSSLLRNAIEAAPAGGWAGIRVECIPNEGLAIIVEDNGPGLKSTDREHLFDPFYSGRKAGRGKGLGLPAAWQLARQHGGDVRLQVSGEGLTRFVLQLPPDAIAEVLPLRISECELRVAN